jgi:hypothetical protein
LVFVGAEFVAALGLECEAGEGWAVGMAVVAVAVDAEVTLWM